MKSEQRLRRKRVSALVPPDHYQQLEKMAQEDREPVSLVVGRIIQSFLSRKVSLTRSADGANVEPCACETRTDRCER